MKREVSVVLLLCAVVLISLFAVLVYATVPVITVTAPSNHTLRTGNVSLTATTDIAANVTINITSGTTLIAQFLSNDASTHSATWQTANGSYSDGVYNITFSALNATNATEIATTLLVTNITIDNSAPTFTASTPTSSASRSKNVTITATVSDATTGVSAVLFDITNSSGSTLTWLTATKSDDTWTTTWQTANGSFPDGLYNISINATNGVGLSNYSPAMVSSFTVDNTLPTLSSISSGTVNDSSATISWSSSEAANSTVNYGTSTSLGSLSTSNSSVTSHSLKLSGLSASTLYHYNVSSCDAAGNCQSSGPNNFTTSAAPSVETTTTTTSSSKSSPVVIPGDVVSVEKNVALTAPGEGAKVGVALNQKVLVGAKLLFAVVSSAKESAENHSILVRTVSATAANLTVQSSPKNFTITVNQSRDIDLDDDAVDDLRVTLVGTNVSVNYAELSLRLLSSGKKVMNVTVNETKPVTAPEKKPNWLDINLLLVLIVAAVLILVVLVFLIFRGGGGKATTHPAAKRSDDIFEGRF